MALQICVMAVQLSAGSPSSLITERHFTMSNTTKFFAVLAALTLSVPALASSGFTPSNSEAGGTRHAMPGGLTRAQVLAELETARRDGSLEKMNSEAGYAPEFNSASSSKPRTRQEVLLELQRAREDGTLREMSRNRS